MVIITIYNACNCIITSQLKIKGFRFELDHQNKRELQENKHRLPLDIDNSLRHISCVSLIEAANRQADQKSRVTIGKKR